MDVARHGRLFRIRALTTSVIEGGCGGGGHLEASPEVVPLAIFRKGDRVVIEHLARTVAERPADWGREETPCRDDRSRVGEHFGKFEEDGTHERKAGARGLVGERVDVRQKTVAGFDVAAANGFLLRPVVPDFVRQAAFGGVIAKERREGCLFNPAREQRRATVNR